MIKISFESILIHYYWFIQLFQIFLKDNIIQANQFIAIIWNIFFYFIRIFSYLRTTSL